MLSGTVGRPALLIAALLALTNNVQASDYCGNCSGPCDGVSPGTPCGPISYCVSSMVECPGGGCPFDCPRKCFCLVADVFDVVLDPPISIPDAFPGGIFVDIPLPPDWPGPDPGPFEGILNIGVAIDHTAIGDLFVAIGHGMTGVVLMDRPGRGTSGSGCLADLSCSRPIAFADGPNPIECGSTAGECMACFPNGLVEAGVYAPNQSLTAFQGQTLGGPWRLFISDNAMGNVGRICAIRIVASIGQPATSVESDQFAGYTWGPLKALFR